MAHKPLPPADYLRECLKYDSKTGVLTWKERPRLHFKTDRVWKWRNTRFSRKPAGCKRPRFVVVVLDKTHYLANRVIWLLQTGTDPGNLEIDHRNRDPLDNRWANLRLATRMQNVRNTLGQSKRGLPKGVCKDHERYRACIGVSGRKICLGTYATPEKAASVYRAFARSLHGRFYADPTQT